MHLTDEKVKRFDKVLAIDPGRRIITTVWSPSSGAFFSGHKRVLQAAMNVRGEEIAEMQNKRRPYDPQNAYHSL